MSASMQTRHRDLKLMAERLSCNPLAGWIAVGSVVFLLGGCSEGEAPPTPTTAAAPLAVDPDVARRRGLEPAAVARGADRRCQPTRARCRDIPRALRGLPRQPRARCASLASARPGRQIPGTAARRQRARLASPARRPPRHHQGRHRSPGRQHAGLEGQAVGRGDRGGRRLDGRPLARRDIRGLARDRAEGGTTLRALLLGAPAALS